MSSEPHTISDVTCLGCGLLCDDLQVRVEGGRLVEAARACDMGRDWLRQGLEDEARSLPTATLDGVPANFDAAIGRAAEILGGARAPLVTGLTEAPIEAQRVAVALADRLGATINPGPVREARGRWLAAQRVGRVGATWGEVRQRADLIVLWGCDPAATHPRFFERLVDPPGRFLPERRAGRTVVLVTGEGESRSARLVDRVIRVGPDGHLASLAALRAMIRGKPVDADRTPAATDLAWLAGRLAAARYGVIVPGLDQGGGAAGFEALFGLVADLNARAEGRCVVVGLGGPANGAGAEAVLGWQAGAPGAIDFSRGHPRHLPREADHWIRMSSRQVDAVLVVEPSRGNGPWLRSLTRQEGAPAVLVAAGATDPALVPPRGVAIACARPGITSGGDVMRADGATLPLTPVLTSPSPPAVDVLRAILTRLGLPEEGS